MKTELLKVKLGVVSIDSTVSVVSVVSIVSIVSVIFCNA